MNRVAKWKFNHLMLFTGNACDWKKLHVFKATLLLVVSERECGFTSETCEVIINIRLMLVWISCHESEILKIVSMNLSKIRNMHQIITQRENPSKWIVVKVTWTDYLQLRVLVVMKASYKIFQSWKFKI